MGDIDLPTGDLSRRSVIKRAAVVGAATAWATPTIQSIASPAFAAGSPKGACTARMTGGGRIDNVTGAEVKFNGQSNTFMTFGLGQIICSPSSDATIEINAHPQGDQKADASFHFTVQSVTCSKLEPNPAPGPGTAKCANVFTGTATNADGYTLTFRLEDHGEGANAMDLDFASFEVTGPNTLSAVGTVTKGNLQVHANIPGVGRDCSGC